LLICQVCVYVQTVNESDEMCCVETPVYSRLVEIVGESVELLCNTSLTTDKVMWTYDNDDDGYVQYVYWKGHIAADQTRLSMKFTGVDYHSLVIDDADQEDSGLYNCYGGEGTRITGYKLIIAGKRSINVYCELI